MYTRPCVYHVAADMSTSLIRSSVGSGSGSVGNNSGSGVPSEPGIVEPESDVLLTLPVPNLNQGKPSETLKLTEAERETDKPETGKAEADKSETDKSEKEKREIERPDEEKPDTGIESEEVPPETLQETSAEGSVVLMLLMAVPIAGSLVVIWKRRTDRLDRAGAGCALGFSRKILEELFCSRK